MTKDPWSQHHDPFTMTLTHDPYFMTPTPWPLLHDPNPMTHTPQTMTFVLDW